MIENKILKFGLIYSYNFSRNYSFLNLEIQRSQYIKVRKLFKGGNYVRKYGIYSLELPITQDWSQLEMTITCSSTVKLMVLAVLDLFAIVRSKLGLISDE